MTGKNKIKFQGNYNRRENDFLKHFGGGRVRMNCSGRREIYFCPLFQWGGHYD